MNDKGYINGYSDGRFHPTATITRAETVKLLDNIIDGYCNNPGSFSINEEEQSGYYVVFRIPVTDARLGPLT